MTETQSEYGTKSFCSFCAKAREDVEILIAGPTVYICNECIDLCSEIIHEEEKKKEKRTKENILKKIDNTIEELKTIKSELLNNQV